MLVYVALFLAFFSSVVSVFLFLLYHSKLRSLMVRMDGIEGRLAQSESAIRDSLELSQRIGGELHQLSALSWRLHDNAMRESEK